MITIRIGRQRLRLDPIEALTDFQRIESRVKAKDRQLSMPLLQLLAEWLRLQGIPAATPTQCWCVWVLVWQYADRIARRYQPLADLAFWYGINPFPLEDSQRLALWANLGRVQAQQQLTTGKFDATDYRGVHRLVLLATGDAELAERAKADALERYVQAEMAKGSK